MSVIVRVCPTGSWGHVQRIDGGAVGVAGFGVSGGGGLTTSHVPSSLAVAEPSVVPAGSGSSITAFSASDGPALVRVSV